MTSCATLGEPAWPLASRGHGTCPTPETDRGSVWAGYRAQRSVPAGAVLERVGALRLSHLGGPSASKLGPPEYVPQAVQPAGCSGSDKPREQKPRDPLLVLLEAAGQAWKEPAPLPPRVRHAGGATCKCSRAQPSRGLGPKPASTAGHRSAPSPTSSPVMPLEICHPGQHLTASKDLPKCLTHNSRIKQKCVPGTSWVTSYAVATSDA